MIRPAVCAFVFACIVAASTLRAEEAPPAKELLKLEGKELIAAADDASASLYTADELITVAEKLMSLGFVREKGQPLNPFWQYFEEACLKANDQQLDKLVKIYTRLEPGLGEKIFVLPALASRLVSREVAAIRAEKGKANLAKTAPALPPELKAGPPELQEAWRAYRRATASFENGFPKVDVQIEVSANEKSFYKLIDAALEGSTGLEDEIRQFADTGAKCLAGTEVEDAQDMAMLLMLLRERRLDEAIGAAIRVAGMEGSISSPEKIADPIMQLIEAFGLDWEMIFAGGQAANELRGGRLGYGNPYLVALAKHGSPRAAVLVNQLAHLASPHGRAAYVAAFGTWIETAPKRQKCNDGNGDVGRSDHESPTGKAMPREIQETSLHITEEFSTADCPEELALYALNVFGRTQATSSIPALQALTRHRSSEVVRDATKVLCAMGVITARQSVAAPVHFRILLNGKPLSYGQRVAWTISSTADMVGGRTEANAIGVVEIPRHHFLNSNGPAKEVEFSAWGNGANEPTFRVTTPVSASLDETTDVPVKMSSLEITLTNQDRLNAPAPKKAFVYFMPHRNERDTSEGLPDAIDGTSDVAVGYGVNVFRDSYDVSAQQSITLPAVQDGVYDVLIGVAGAEVWRGIARVGPGAPKTSAVLKAGSDVRFEVVMPDGSGGFRAEVFKDGKKFHVEMRYAMGWYRALPCGHYEICISGSEWIDEYRQNSKLKRGPDEVPYAGREIFFEITEGSPATIDLGEIRLETIDQP